MKGTRHSEELIIAILKQGEAGLTTAELCRQHGITEQTHRATLGDGGDERLIKRLSMEKPSCIAQSVARNARSWRSLLVPLELYLRRLSGENVRRQLLQNPASHTDLFPLVALLGFFQFGGIGAPGYEKEQRL